MVAVAGGAQRPVRLTREVMQAHTPPHTNTPRFLGKQSAIRVKSRAGVTQTGVWNQACGSIYTATQESSFSTKNLATSCCCM